MNLIIQYGLLGLVLGLGLGLGFILYCRIWRPLALPYMCSQPTNGGDGTYGDNIIITQYGMDCAHMDFFNLTYRTFSVTPAKQHMHTQMQQIVMHNTCTYNSFM